MTASRSRLPLPLIVLTVLAGLVIYSVGRLRRMTPRIETNWTQVVSSAVVELRKSPKLVVLQTVFDVHETVVVSTSCEWLGVDLCRDLTATRVAMTARGCVVQHVVELDGVTAADFTRTADALVVRLPAPRIDAGLVEVPAGLDKIDFVTENGLLKLDRWSGAPVRDEMRVRLRAAALATARANPTLQETAERNGREKIAALLAAAVPGKVRVEFVERK